MTRVTWARMCGPTIELETSLALGVGHLAQVRPFVPERLIPSTSLIRFERLSAIDENTLAARVTLVVELAAGREETGQRATMEEQKKCSNGPLKVLLGTGASLLDLVRLGQAFSDVAVAVADAAMEEGLTARE